MDAGKLWMVTFVTKLYPMALFISMRSPILEALGIYTLVYLVGGGFFRLSHNIGFIIDEMNVLDFVRCHRSYYGNVRFMVNLVYNKDGNFDCQIEYPGNVFIKCCPEMEEEMALAISELQEKSLL